VELYEQIRREYEFVGGFDYRCGAEAGLCIVAQFERQFEVRCRRGARRHERPHLKIGPRRHSYDAVLEADRKAPRKQRHHGEAHLGTDTS